MLDVAARRVRHASDVEPRPAPVAGVAVPDAQRAMHSTSPAPLATGLERDPGATGSVLQPTADALATRAISTSALEQAALPESLAACRAIALASLRRRAVARNPCCVLHGAGTNALGGTARVAFGRVSVERLDPAIAGVDLADGNFTELR